MKYKKVKNKYVFAQDGVYFALTLDQVRDIFSLSNEILNRETLNFDIFKELLNESNIS